MAAGAFDQVIGKTIARVVYKSNPKPPYQQVFLLFQDGTYFEIYGGESEPIKGAKGVLPGGLERTQEIGQEGEAVTTFPAANTRQGDKGGNRDRPGAILKPLKGFLKEAGSWIGGFGLLVGSGVLMVVLAQALIPVIGEENGTFVGILLGALIGFLVVQGVASWEKKKKARGDER